MIARLGPWLKARRNTVLMLVSLICGAVALYSGQQDLTTRLDAERLRLQPKPPRLIDVVVARRDVNRGEPVSADTMAIRQIPAEYVASTAIRPEQFDDLQGARLALPLRGGEALLHSAIIGGETMAFSARVKPGIRALTIAVDEINSISGMLQPGDRIDLLFSAKPPDGPGHAAPESTITLFQNLLVLATGRQIRPGTDERQGPRPFSSVTVEVEPDHAQRLVVAQRAGKLTAVLRNPDDSARLASKSMDIRQLLQLPTPQHPPPSRPRWQGPQLIVGGMGRGSVAVTGSALPDTAPSRMAAPPAAAPAAPAASAGSAPIVDVSSVREGLGTRP